MTDQVSSPSESSGRNKQVGVFLFNGIMGVFSFLLLWGWITISDIKTTCRTKGYDSDEVLEALYQRHHGFKMDGEGFEITPPSRSLFGRLLWGWVGVSQTQSKDKSDGDKGSQLSFTEFGLLEWFLKFSENMLNLFFSFGVGYLVSTVLMLVMFLRGESMTLRYLIIRPLAGGLVSACFLLLVVCGGTLLWEHATNLQGLSIGVIAIIGSLYCEKFPEILKASVPLTKLSEEKK